MSLILFASILILNVLDVRDFGAVGDEVTDDTKALSAAIETKRDVHVPKGRYAISLGLSALSDNQNFTMDKDAWITSHPSTTYDGVIVLQPGNYSRITANIDMATGVGYTVEKSLYSYGIYPIKLGIVGVVVENCDLRNIGVGIRAQDARNWKVSNNRIFNTGTSAMLFGASATGKCSGNIFSGNHCTQCGDTGLAFWAENVFGGEISGNIVNANVFRETQYVTDGYALDIEANEAYGKQINNILTNNVIDQTARVATVVTNVFTVDPNPWKNGMRASYDKADIAHYVVNRTATTLQLSLTLGGPPIAVADGTHTVIPAYRRGGIVSGDYSEKTIISGNSCTGHGLTLASTGINVNRNRHSIVSNNIVEKFSYYGISTADSKNCKVSGNVLLSNGIEHDN